MNYLFARKVPPRQPGDEPLDLKWAEYFDIVIVGGNKPAFLIDEGYVRYVRIRSCVVKLFSWS